MDKKTVLIAEDDEGIRGFLIDAIKEHGYDVLAAEDGAKALALVDGADIVVLDLSLPKVSGEEFLRRVRAEGNYVPAVVVSGSIGCMDAMKRLGIVDFIPKPFSLSQVLLRVDRCAEIADNIGFVGEATDQLKAFIERQGESQTFDCRDPHKDI